ncbi:MAG: outer membrane beta-barrel protein [Acidobacteriota bacterium]
MSRPLFTVPRRVGLRLAGVFVLLVLLALPTEAGAAPRYDHGIDLSVGFAYGATDYDVFIFLNPVPGNESEFDFGLVALRYHHRFSDIWGIEASLSYTDELISRVRDAYFVDVSARWTIFESDRAEVYGVFGPGILFYNRPLGSPVAFDQTSLPTQLEQSDETPSAHVGVGALFALSERTYLRTDARYRRLLDIFGPIDEQNFDVSVGVGLRF